MPALPVGAALPAHAPLAASAAPARPFRVALAAAHAAARPAPSPAAAPVRAALEGIERAQRRLDALLASARQGRTFTAQELLGLQAEAYRAVQTVDLAAKLVEQGAQAVKQAVNTPL